MKLIPTSTTTLEATEESAHAIKNDADDRAQTKKFEALLEEQGQELEKITIRCRKLVVENKRLKCVGNGNKNPPSIISGESTGGRTIEDQKVTILLQELEQSNESVQLGMEKASGLELRIVELESLASRLSSEKKSTEDILRQTEQKLALRELSLEKLRQNLAQTGKTKSQLSADVEGMTKETDELRQEYKALSDKFSLASDRTEEIQSMLSNSLKNEENVSSELSQTKLELERIRKDLLNNSEKNLKMNRKLTEATDKMKEERMKVEKLKRLLDQSLISQDKAETMCTLLQEQAAFDESGTAGTNKMQELVDFVTTFKSHHSEELSSRQLVIDELTLQNAKLVSSAERSAREKDSIEEKFIRLSTEQQEERKSAKNSIGVLVDRAVKAESLLAETKKENQGLLHYRANVEIQMGSMEKRLEEVQEKAREEKKRLESALIEANLLQRSKEASAITSTRELTRLRKAIEAERQDFSTKVREARAHEKTLHQEFESELRRHKNVISEKEAVYHQQEQKLSKERDICHRLLEQSKQLNRSIQELSVEKVDLVRINAEKDDTIECLTAVVKEAENKVTLLGNELNLSIREQEARIVQERQLRGELRQARSDLHYTLKQNDGATDLYKNIQFR